ncbi:MAG: DUF4177 domain-containing protein [Bacillota bacterium]
MAKWEYKIINFKTKGATNLVLSREDEDELNKLGDLGWELVTSAPTVNGRTICCILKKQKVENV